MHTYGEGSGLVPATGLGVQRAPTRGKFSIQLETPMRLFMAGFATETNTFLPFPTGEAGFAATLALGRQASRATDTVFNAPLIEWRRLAEADGHNVAESLYASAQPSGIVVRAVYERIRDEILADLRAALPVDLVLLNLHGAMVAE